MYGGNIGLVARFCYLYPPTYTVVHTFCYVKKESNGDAVQ